MAGKEVKIQINTAANIAGAKQAEQAIEQATQKAASLSRTLGSTNSTLDAVEMRFAHATKTVESFSRALGDGGQRGLQQFLDETADKARVTEFAFYDLDAKVEKATRTTNSAATANDKLGGSAQGSAMKLLIMGQAVDDLQYGVRGVLNNIPQLVMAFGGGAGLAGGISIAAVALSQLTNLFDEADEKAKKFEIDLEQIGRNAAANILDKLDERAKELERLDQLYAIDRQPDKGGQDAANRAAQSRLEQLRTIAEVTKVLNQLLERQTSALETIAAAEKQRAAERQAEMRKAIEFEEEKVKAAKEVLINIQAEYDKKQEAAAARAKQIEQAREELEVLRAQKKEYEELAKKNQSATAFNPGGENPFVLAPPGGAPASLGAWTGPSPEEMDKQLKIAESKRNSLEGVADELVKSIDALYVKIYEAEKNLRQKTAESQRNIDTILEGAGAQEVADKAKTITEGNSEIIDRLQQAVSLAEGQTGVAKQAADNIRAAISDGNLTLREVEKLPTDVQLLVGTFKGEVTALQNVMRGMVGDLNEIKSRTRELERLREQMSRSNGPMAPRPNQ